MKMTLGQRIRMYRKAAGLTQQELADALGVSSAAVKTWEAGTARPRFERMGDLASLLYVSVSDLLGESTVSDLSWDETELIDEYRLLPPEVRFRVLGEVDELVRNLSER